ncbi:MAG: 50S ribosomal protein L25 [Patescibacteria group bacterium]|nr:50S ribosomal protein L25 [Patescibacteria group bacterium]
MFKLSAVKREIKGEKARAEGLLPAVVYGAGKENEALSLVYSEFNKLYNEAGESSLVDLAVDNKDFGKVLIHEVQYDPVKGRMVHADLLKIDMNKPITAKVELSFIGEAPAVKESGGTLVHNFDTVEIECLPKDLVNHFDIDLSVLKTFDDAIRVSDIKLPDGVAIIVPSLETIIAKALPALTEEQIKAMEAESTKDVDLSKIESAAPKKETEEGETAEAGAEEAPAKEKKEEKK